MRTNYLLIDYENVQPKSLSRLSGRPFTVKVFLGAQQKNVPLDLAKTLQSLGANADYVLMSGSGRHALDFHVAFYLGELVAKDPGGSFTLISKGKGFDPLVKHLQARGIAAQRFTELGEIPIDDLFSRKLRQDEVNEVVAALQKRGVLVVTGGKVSYSPRATAGGPRKKGGPGRKARAAPASA